LKQNVLITDIEAIRQICCRNVTMNKFDRSDLRILCRNPLTKENENGEEQRKYNESTRSLGAMSDAHDLA
jgi:hypothetical protein